jgi:2-phosphosulfolactate phosphatase
LAGERDGVLITSELTGSISFDFGNSPREFSAESVAGRRIAITTTNGTRALRACARAKTVFVASFLNLRATAKAILAEKPEELSVLCSGTYDQAAYEDTLGAGALVDILQGQFNRDETGDGAFMAHQLYNQSERPLFRALGSSRNGRRLLTRGELAADVQFCSQVDKFPVIARLSSDGTVRKSM